MSNLTCKNSECSSKERTHRRNKVSTVAAIVRGGFLMICITQRCEKICDFLWFSFHASHSWSRTKISFVFILLCTSRVPICYWNVKGVKFHRYEKENERNRWFELTSINLHTLQNNALQVSFLGYLLWDIFQIDFEGARVTFVCLQMIGSTIYLDKVTLQEGSENRMAEAISTAQRFYRGTRSLFINHDLLHSVYFKRTYTRICTTRCLAPPTVRFRDI